MTSPFPRTHASPRLLGLTYTCREPRSFSILPYIYTYVRVSVINRPSCILSSSSSSSSLKSQREKITPPVSCSFKQQMSRKRDAEAELNLPPGFRFHPTDEELVVHYLCRKITYQSLPVPIIAEVDLYKYDPWQLPDKALFGAKEWYFFTPRDRKYPNGSRPNRAAGNGYWKATGADKPIKPTGSNRTAGIKKALVFYAGKAPKGAKTNWIMHEYRVAEPSRSVNKKGSLRLDDWVLCRLYNKKNGLEKVVLKPETSTSLGETEDSFDVIEDAGTDSFRTPESDVENGSVAERNKIIRNVPSHPSQPLDVNGNSQMVANLKEENDWFMGISMEDLQNSFGVFGEAPVSDFMVSQDCSFPWLFSPRVKMDQTSLLPF